MPLYEDFIQTNLDRLRDALLYRANPTFRNPAWADSGPRVLILRLSPFRDVERSSPHLFLAAAVRHAAADGYVDMAFLPQRQDRQIIQGAGVPLILGTQSHRSLSDFDLILVSNSCIPELVNLPFLLRGSGVPLWAGTRGPEWPAIILGGSSSAAAHPVVKPDGDCMADAIFFGEGEGAVEKIIGAWRDEDEAKADRIRRLAAAVPGLWLAGDLSRPVRRAHAPDGPAVSLPCPILPGEEAGTARLAITRGCPCLCSFCFEAYDRRPFRQFSVASLLDAGQRIKRESGADTLEIESFNFNTHEGIVDLLLGLNRMFLRVNAMSQRADILAAEPGLLACEVASGKRTFTLGIEGVSERQRRFLHKSLQAAEIRKVLQALHREPVREIKLFFVLTGREEDADMKELAGLVGWLKDVRAGAGPRVIFSFGLLVRMPFTPLRYDRLFLEQKAWKRIIGKAKSICETNGFEFRLAAPWKDYRLIQVLAAGEYELARLMEDLASAGCVYDGEFPPEAQGILDAWLASDAVSTARFLREKPADHVFPFGFLESAEERAALYKRWEDAAVEKDGGYCRRGSPDGGCTDCPGCKLHLPRMERTRRTAAGGSPSRSLEIGRLQSGKARLKPLFLRAWIPEEAACTSRHWRDAWLLSRFLELCPDQSGNVLSARESLVTAWAERAAGPIPPWFGHGVAELTAWDTEELAQKLEGVPAPEELPWSFHSPFPSPPSWKSLSVRLTLPRGLAPDAVRRISPALEAMHTPVTIRREGEWYEIHVGEKSMRRKGIRSGRYPAGSNHSCFELSFGPAFDLGAFLALLDPSAAFSAIFEVIQLEL